MPLTHPTPRPPAPRRALASGPQALLLSRTLSRLTARTTARTTAGATARHLACTLALALLGTGAVADTTAPKAKAGAADAQAKVQALIGDAACRSDADCHTLPVGRRACGGPAQYLPWSAWRTSGKALTDAAAPTLKAAPAEGEGMMGTCQVLMDPGAQCQRAAGAASSTPGRCVLRQAPALPPVR